MSVKFKLENWEMIPNSLQSISCRRCAGRGRDCPHCSGEGHITVIQVKNIVDYNLWMKSESDTCRDNSDKESDK